MTNHYRYYLGIGSNVAPTQNLPQIIAHLLNRFHRLRLSPIIETLPIGMSSRSPFLNGVVYLESPQESSALKIELNEMEAALGRDRSDPLKKVKDRPADIDILFTLGFNEQLPAHAPTEPYLTAPFLHLLATHQTLSPPLPTLHGVHLQLEGADFGHTVVELSRNRDRITATPIPPLQNPL